jgi:hypothetical protein
MVVLTEVTRLCWVVVFWLTRTDQEDIESKETPTPSPPEDSPRFFNPAIIPLPYWSQPAKYILVSRMVTSGFHQESHICLADMCRPLSPPSQSRSPGSRSQRHLPADTRSCKPSDLAHLGPGGGLRCITTPLKVNIPSTPAEKCEGPWLAFPDIPGFHDPRVFWSGKGEPLILVNSASRYGCVGLWIVDLRRVYPMLQRVLERGSSGVSNLVERAGTEDNVEKTEDSQAQLGKGLAPSISYPYLTEITRNPRESRAKVEKNWVLWFPNGGEAYVQYDLLGHVVADHADLEELLGVGQGLEVAATGEWNGNLTISLGYVNATNTTYHGVSGTLISNRKSRRWQESKPRGGRAFAKLAGNGFTTPNLTHPDEQPCFSAEQGHFKDSLGNAGHWHQGSNSLRLILCTRAQARLDPACRDDEDARLSDNSTLRVGAMKSGRSVHLAVMHRKFSNVLDLPLRYERYVVVWEGKEPFQLLGVSQYPLLMKNEWAKPWTEAENWPKTPRWRN